MFLFRRVIIKLRVETTIYNSDKRYKIDIKPLSSADRLTKLNSVEYKSSSEVHRDKVNSLKKSASEAKNEEESYRHKMDLGAIEGRIKEIDADTVTKFGFIAQELREIYPNLVYEDEEGYLGVDYVGLIPVLVEVIKEQQYQINELKENVKYFSAKVLAESESPTNSSRLYQNSPNPFDERTEIKYYTPENSMFASIIVYDLTGSQLIKFDLSNKGSSSLVIDGNKLKAGMYIYTLLVDGREVDTKKMILTK